jgi:uncharacterized protein (DUF433 family)
MLICRKDMTTDRIEINPNVMLGKPVIRGTRITVEKLVQEQSDKLYGAFVVIEPGQVRVSGRSPTLA